MQLMAIDVFDSVNQFFGEIAKKISGACCSLIGLIVIVTALALLFYIKKKRAQS